MNYERILLEDGLKEVQQQKLELIALTGNEAPKEIRKINLIEMQLERALIIRRRNKFLDVDIRDMKKLKRKGYTEREIAIVFNTQQAIINKNLQ
jgi:hypothetical protein